MTGSFLWRTATSVSATSTTPITEKMTIFLRFFGFAMAIVYSDMFHAILFHLFGMPGRKTAALVGNNGPQRGAQAKQRTRVGDPNSENPQCSFANGRAAQPRQADGTDNQHPEQHHIHQGAQRMQRVLRV